MALDPVTAVANVFDKGLGILDQYVEDKDLKAKLGFELSRLQIDMQRTVVTMSTTPTMDAFVKLLYATRDVIIPMLRPLGASLLTGAAVYMEMHHVAMPEWLTAMLGSAFPSWMVSRHLDKRTEKIEETKRQTIAAQKEVAQSGNPFFGNY